MSSRWTVSTSLRSSVRWRMSRWYTRKLRIRSVSWCGSRSLPQLSRLHAGLEQGDAVFVAADRVLQVGGPVGGVTAGLVDLGGEGGGEAVVVEPIGCVLDVGAQIDGTTHRSASVATARSTAGRTPRGTGRTGRASCGRSSFARPRCARRSPRSSCLRTRPRRSDRASPQ